jgi:formate hydrogenlyase subunit 5
VPGVPVLSEHSLHGVPVREVPIDALGAALEAKLAEGHRFAGLFALAETGRRIRLRSLVASGQTLCAIDALVPEGAASYEALTPKLPAAAWYEREIRDLYGLHPRSHPRLDPVVLPLRDGAPPPMPGTGDPPPRALIDPSPLPAHLVGKGVLTLPYGPVRSGVFEAVEYLLETPGEELPHVRSRVYYKHRGLEKRFDGMTPRDGVLLAERVEGVASVAHAIAYCEAIEKVSGAKVPRHAKLLRVFHAEVERVVNHLESVVRHCEAAGQAVACARLAYHKELLMRLRARACGHRFARGVVVPGGVAGPPFLPPGELASEVARLGSPLKKDLALLMETPSFLDRLRGTGMIPPERALAHGLLGPVGRGSGMGEDVRRSRPYAAYEELSFTTHHRLEGDALSRQHVRVAEVATALDLACQAATRLGKIVPPGDASWAGEPGPERDLDATGEAIGWVEAPQGELLYLVRVEDGVLTHVKPRSASFHNFALFPEAFRGDIFTDFAFIEASFGISIAGVAG